MGQELAERAQGPEGLADRYTYRVFWSEEDAEWVGLCAEFPSLSWLAESRTAALEGIVQVVRDVLVDMSETKETPPAPLGSKQYTGVFQVRIPPSAHRSLALEAAEQGVSLNSLVKSKLGAR